jgi:hypothetical protein
MILRKKYNRALKENNYDPEIVDIQDFALFHENYRKNIHLPQRPIPDLTDLISYPGKKTLEEIKNKQRRQETEYGKNSPRSWRGTNFQQSRSPNVGRTAYQGHNFKKLIDANKNAA